MVQYQYESVCKVFNALGDPTRMAMFREISQGDTTATALAKPHGITVTATLKHLRLLEQAGLAETFKVGRERKCRLKLESLNEAERWIEETRRHWNFRLDNLGALLEKIEDEQ